MTGLTVVLMFVVVALALLARYASLRHEREAREREREPVVVTVYDELLRNRSRSPVSREQARSDMSRAA